jgi:hypothetical protein
MSKIDWCSPLILELYLFSNGQNKPQLINLKSTYFSRLEAPAKIYCSFFKSGSTLFEFRLLFINFVHSSVNPGVSMMAIDTWALHKFSGQFGVGFTG